MAAVLPFHCAAELVSLKQNHSTSIVLYTVRGLSRSLEMLVTLLDSATCV